MRDIRLLNATMARHCVDGKTNLVITNLPILLEEHKSAPASYAELLHCACEGLPPTLFVCSGSDIFSPAFI